MGRRRETEAAVRLEAQEAKGLLYEQLARIGRALASPVRLEMVELLAQGERPVEGVARALGLPVANASHHLRALRAAHLVEARREGAMVRYRLSDPRVHVLLREIRGLAEDHLAEVERIVRAYYRARDALEPVRREELLERVRAGEVLVVDVRPPEEYRAGHIPGALSLPLEALERRLASLPRDREIVAYCRGPYCVMALEAVARLRERGLRARRLEDGFPEWRAAGLPVATGEAETTTEEESP